MVGTGSNNPQAALKDTQYAETLNIDATLHVALIQWPNQGLYQHFKCIHDATTKPYVYLQYSLRAGCDVEPRYHGGAQYRVVGVKDATGQQLRIWDENSVLLDFCWLSGDDLMLLFIT